MGLERCNGCGVAMGEDEVHGLYRYTTAMGTFNKTFCGPDHNGCAETMKQYFMRNDLSEVDNE